MKFRVVVNVEGSDQQYTKDVEALRFEVTPLGALVFYDQHENHTLAYPSEAFASGRWYQVFPVGTE